MFVAHSRIDAVVPPTVGDLIERAIPGPVERACFDESGHSTTVDVAASRVAEAVAAFLANGAGAQ